MRKRRRELVPEISLSFLDVISCGFGAIVLLLLIAKTVESTALEKAPDFEGSVRKLQEQLFEIRGETANSSPGRNSFRKSGNAWPGCGNNWQAWKNSGMRWRKWIPRRKKN